MGGDCCGDSRTVTVTSFLSFVLPVFVTYEYLLTIALIVRWGAHHKQWLNSRTRLDCDDASLSSARKHLEERLCDENGAASRC